PPSRRVYAARAGHLSLLPWRTTDQGDRLASSSGGARHGGKLMVHRFALGLTAVSTLVIGGCDSTRTSVSPSGTVTVYAALDREFAAPILEAYAQRTAVSVLPKFDVESTKTVGLTNLIMAEAVHPRCDLFWNNEILNTLRLKEKGLLVRFRPRHADDLPATFK